MLFNLPLNMLNFVIFTCYFRRILVIVYTLLVFLYMCHNTIVFYICVTILLFSSYFHSLNIYIKLLLENRLKFRRGSY